MWEQDCCAVIPLLKTTQNPIVNKKKKKSYCFHSVAFKYLYSITLNPIQLLKTSFAKYSNIFFLFSSCAKK